MKKTKVWNIKLHNYNPNQRRIMSIQLPPDNIFDRILAFFGKRRVIIMPKHLDKTINQFGQHATIKVKKEGFLTALLFNRKF